jgi:hypothetical protein
MKKLCNYILLFIILLVAKHECLAQQGGDSALVFEMSTLDFGVISEVDGCQSRRFCAVNSGNEEVFVKEIVTSCGCTSVNYHQGGIPSGATFCFDVVYDPTNRPGRFERDILVSVSDAEHPIELRIVGRVEPRDKTVYELYPFDFGGGLRLQSNFHAFGYLEHGKVVEEKIAYINMSEQSIHVVVERDNASGLLGVDVPSTIAPGAMGDIVMRYDVDSNSTVYGVRSDVMHLVVDGVKSQYPLSTQVVVVDNFDSMDDISAPKFAISKNIIKFGEVNCHSGEITAYVTLSNMGSSPLYVRAIESTTEAVRGYVEGGMTIAPGCESRLVVVLAPSLIEDVDNPLVSRLMIVTNDPLRPMQTIKVSALPL